MTTAGAVLPEIRRIIPGFDLVYFTLDWHPLDHCSFREQGGPWPPHCVHHTAGASLPDSVLAGLDESKLRFVLKGCRSDKEEYGAFSGTDAAEQDYFMPGDKVLLLHAGDFSQGTSYFSELGGQLEPRMINALGYDCVTLGNHEFDNGIEDLESRLAMLTGTRVVSSNIDVSQFGLAEYVEPYVIIEKAGLKIGIIGLESDLSANVSAVTSSRIPQLDDVEVTNRWAGYLHDTEKCDLIILLSHAGYSVDQEIVPQTRYLDLVVGGHSHTFVDDFLYVEDLDGRKVPIITDGCFGVEMGEIKIY